MNLETIARQHQKDLGELDQEILAYIIDNQALVTKMSIIELGEAVHTSKSTILRLTKKIGFTGFSEFKYFIKQNQQEDTTAAKVDIFDAQQQDIQRTIAYLDNVDFSRILQEMHRSETIYCYGTGYSQRKIVDEFSKMMMAVEKRVICLPNSTEFDMAMPMIKKADMVIFVSLSGETEEVKENLISLKMRGITTMAFTAFGDNFFSKNADYALFYYITPIAVGKKSYVTSLVSLSCGMDYLFRKFGEFLYDLNESDELADTE
ncbi:MurR/RpiR family transcriptional regulator [Enterococcus sp. LJL90]